MAFQLHRPTSTIYITRNVDGMATCDLADALMARLRHMRGVEDLGCRTNGYDGWLVTVTYNTTLAESCYDRVNEKAKNFCQEMDGIYIPPTASIHVTNQ